MVLSKPADMAELARQLGVHVSTVSRALRSNPTGVSAATVERVRDLADAVGYRRNLGAAALRTGQSRLIGVLVPRLTDPVLATVYEGIDEAASEAGYNTVVTNTLDDSTRRHERLESLLSRRVQGLILGDSHLGSERSAELRSIDVPYVLVVRRLAGHISISTNDIKGGRMAAEHLLGLGHQRVAVIGGDATASTGLERTLGFCRRYAEAGLPLAAHSVVNSGFSVTAGSTATEALLALAPRPTAIFAIDDLVAVGAMGSLRNAGLRVGEDMALIGYNDLEISSQLPVPLSSIRSPLVEMGVESVKALLQIIAGAAAASRQLEPELVARATTLRR